MIIFGNFDFSLYGEPPGVLFYPQGPIHSCAFYVECAINASNVRPTYFPSHLIQTHVITRVRIKFERAPSQKTFTCSKSIKYIQNLKQRQQNYVVDVILVSLLCLLRTFFTPCSGVSFATLRRYLSVGQRVLTLKCLVVAIDYIYLK